MRRDNLTQHDLVSSLARLIVTRTSPRKPGKCRLHRPDRTLVGAVIRLGVNRVGAFRLLSCVERSLSSITTVANSVSIIAPVLVSNDLKSHFLTDSCTPTGLFQVSYTPRRIARDGRAPSLPRSAHRGRHFACCIASEGVVIGQTPHTNSLGLSTLQNVTAIVGLSKTSFQTHR